MSKQERTEKKPATRRTLTDVTKEARLLSQAKAQPKSSSARPARMKKVILGKSPAKILRWPRPPISAAAPTAGHKKSGPSGTVVATHTVQLASVATAKTPSPTETRTLRAPHQPEPLTSLPEMRAPVRAESHVPRRTETSTSHSPAHLELHEFLRRLESKLDGLPEAVRQLIVGPSGRAKSQPPPDRSAPLDPNQGLDAKAAAEFLGVGRSTFYTLRELPEFPKPIQVGKRCVRYRLSELIAWQATRKVGVGENSTASD